MSNLREFMAQSAKTEQIKRANDRFAFKSFSERYQSLRGQLAGLRWLFHSFSVLTGFTFLFLLIDSMLQSWQLSGLLAGLLLIAWEVIKSSLITTTTEQLYSDKSFPFVALFALAALAGSVFFSLQGAQDFQRISDTSKKELSAMHAAKVDSLQAHYAGLIEAERAELASYKNSVSWRGKIDIHNKATKAKIEASTKRVLSLQNQLSDKVVSINDQYNERLTEVKQSSSFNAFAFMILAGCNELLILLCGWFLVYYDFRLFQEGQVLAGSNKFTLTHADISSLISRALTHSTKEPEPEMIEARGQQSTIGFSLSNFSVNQEKQHSVKQAGIKKEPRKEHSVREHLIADIKAGNRDYRTLMKRHGVNVVTVKKYIEQYG